MAPGPRDRMASIISLFLFRLGQLILLVGFMCFMIGITTSFWVIRPPIDYQSRGVDPDKVDVIKHFGIFTACRQGASGQDDVGSCGKTSELINFVDADAVRFVQALMIISSIMYFAGLVLDIIQVMPISSFRNFLAENRLVEMFTGIASVLALSAMVIYAGEVKNKAELVPGQEDEEVGWSFTIAIVGLCLCVVGLLMVTMFRHLPVPVPNNMQYAKGGSWLRIKNSNAST